jgi:hypothetical protein
LATFWEGLPEWGRIGLVVLVAIQLGVQVFALVRLFRTPDERLIFGKKWPWALIILFVNLVGAILFLAVGRTAAPAADPLAGDGPASQRETASRAARAADVLYGAREDDAS